MCSQARAGEEGGGPSAPYPLAKQQTSPLPFSLWALISPSPVQRRDSFATDLKLWRWFHGAGHRQGSTSTLPPGQRDQSPFVSSPACQGGQHGRARGWRTRGWRHMHPPGSSAAGPGGKQRVGGRGQARQSPCCPGRGAIAAQRCRPPAQPPSPVSPLCSLALDLIPYNTWDLSLSLSCAFKETPLFISFLVLFIITKGF